MRSNVLTSATFFSLLLLTGWTSVLRAQAPPDDNLKIVIINGDQFTNNIKKRTSREPVVEVRDRNNKRVPGAAVTFLLPQDGAGGTFANGGKLLNVLTDQNGRAAARTLRPNNVQGTFQIHVTAAAGGQTGAAVITQTNALIGAGLAAGTAGVGTGAGIGTGGAIGATTIAVIAGGVATAAIVTAKVLTNGSAKKGRITLGQPTIP